MMTFNVEITDDALQDLSDLYDYIAVNLQSPMNAERQLKRLMAEIMSLDVFPERHGIVDIEPLKEKCLHFMPVDNYIVFYILREQRVIVTNVLYSASNLITRLSKSQPH